MGLITCRVIDPIANRTQPSWIAGYDGNDDGGIYSGNADGDHCRIVTGEDNYFRDWKYCLLLLTCAAQHVITKGEVFILVLRIRSQLKYYLIMI